MNKTIIEIILNCISSIGELENREDLLHPTEEMRLFGNKGMLDSVGIVMLITEVEEQIDNQLGFSITLADDRAMSQKTSPFRSVKTLQKYIDILIQEQVLNLD